MKEYIILLILIGFMIFIYINNYIIKKYNKNYKRYIYSNNKSDNYLSVNDKYSYITNNYKIIDNSNTDIYVINLKRKPDRLKRFFYKFNNSGLNNINLNIFEAVDGNNIDPINYFSTNAYNKYINKVYGHMSKGALGCSLSHYGIYKQILNSHKDYGLILEDDADLETNMYQNVIKDVLNYIPEDWDIIFFGLTVNDINVNKYEEYEKYMKIYNFYGTYAYIINKKGIKKLMKNILPVNEPIDTYISKLGENNEINLYSINEPIYVTDVISDIR